MAIRDFEESDVIRFMELAISKDIVETLKKYISVWGKDSQGYSQIETYTGYLCL